MSTEGILLILLILPEKSTLPESKLPWPEMSKPSSADFKSADKSLKAKRSPTLSTGASMCADTNMAPPLFSTCHFAVRFPEILGFPSSMILPASKFARAPDISMTASEEVRLMLPLPFSRASYTFARKDDMTRDLSFFDSKSALRSFNSVPLIFRLPDCTAPLMSCLSGLPCSFKDTSRRPCRSKASSSLTKLLSLFASTSLASIRALSSNESPFEVVP